MKVIPKGSYSVMQQRHEPNDSLDDFPTPPFAARALMEHVIEHDPWDTLWEPAVNRGHLLKGLSDYFNRIIASDVFDYGLGYHVKDFLPIVDEDYQSVDWVITNPPFRLGLEFAIRGMEVARKGVALLTRTSFLEGGKRHDLLFEPFPPAIVAQFVERVPMVKARLDPNASTATSYCWIVWMNRPAAGRQSTEFVWIPKCRKALERPGDYPIPPDPIWDYSDDDGV